MADIQGWAVIATIPWLPDQTSVSNAEESRFLTDLGERLVLKNYLGFREKTVSAVC